MECSRNIARTTPLPCESQRLKLSFLFAISISSLNMFALISGSILDLCGPRITASVSALVVAYGLNLFGSGSPGEDGEYRYIVGFFLFSVAGPLCYMCTISFCNFFPRRSGLITSLCVGSFDASSLILVLLATAYNHYQTPFESLFYYYSIIPTLCCCLCFLFYPMVPVQQGQLEQSLLGEKRRTVVLVENCYEHLSFWQQLFSWQFAVPCWTVCVYMVRINFSTFSSRPSIIK